MLEMPCLSLFGTQFSSTCPRLPTAGICDSPCGLEALGISCPWEPPPRERLMEIGVYPALPAPQVACSTLCQHDWAGSQQSPGWWCTLCILPSRPGLAFLFPSGVSWDHLPNKAFVLKFLSWILFLGKSNQDPGEMFLFTENSLWHRAVCPTELAIDSKHIKAGVQARPAPVVYFVEGRGNGGSSNAGQWLQKWD